MKNKKEIDYSKSARSERIPALKWVDQRKQKPPMGEEVIVTNGEGRRDIAEYFPGTGWTGAKFAWSENLIDGIDSGMVFWCRIPEDPEFSVSYKFKQR